MAVSVLVISWDEYNVRTFWNHEHRNEFSTWKGLWLQEFTKYK